MKTARRIQFTPKPRTLREKEIVHKYVELLREQHKKYQKLHKYNERVYAHYVGYTELVRSILKDQPDDPKKVEVFRSLDNNFIQPFHPLKNK